MFHDRVVASHQLEHFLEQELLLDLVLLLDCPELFAEPGEGTGDESDLGLFGSQEFIPWGLLNLADCHLLAGLEHVAMTVGGHLLHLQRQMVGDLEHLLVDRRLKLLPSVHYRLEGSLGFRPHEELAVPGSAHVDALLDHSTYFADDAHVVLKCLLKRLEGRLRYLSLLEVLDQFFEGLHCPVDLDEVRHIAAGLLASCHFVKDEVEPIEVRQLFELVLDEGLQGGVGEEVFHPVQPTLDLFCLLERLPHPSLEASGSERGLALVQQLEYGVIGRKNLPLHLLPEDLEGVGRGRVEEHTGLEVDYFQLELGLIPGFPLEVDDFQESFEGGSSSGFF